VQGRGLRVIQRKLAARYLSPEIVARRKQGFSSALPYVLRKEYLLLSERYLRNSALVSAGIFNGRTVDRLLTEHFDRGIDHGNRLWLLINSEVWYRMLILQQQSEDLRTMPDARLATAA
jgi:asparagine synthase (glutamine-hydrolysing)